MPADLQSDPALVPPSCAREELALERRGANFVTLSPLDFLRRAALVYPHKTAIVYGDIRISYEDFYRRARCLASALVRAGIQVGDTVAVMAPNVPALLEAHFGVPMAGAVLNAVNTRLDAATIGFGLRHSGAKLLIADRDYSAVVKAAIAVLDSPLPVIDIVDPEGLDRHPTARAIGTMDYETFLLQGNPDDPWTLPLDEWQSIALNYTSGTTGAPKGVLYHHRGAYLNAMGNALAFRLIPDSVYLWTLPMFHCNGWSHTWAVTLACATHVCLRKIDPAVIFRLIGEERVTHFCGAPIVLNMLVHSPAKPDKPYAQRVDVATGGAAPPSVIIEHMENLGFHITQLYGLTETFGPAATCDWQHDWDGLDLAGRASKMARQGVPMPTQHEVEVIDVITGEPAPNDGVTLGEIAIRGNTVMKGYLNNPQATEEAFRNGWFHSGDLAVRHPDQYIEIRDRAKDIVISGGENISSLEVEQVLYRHPAIMDAAVVARPDEKWGETPCAFVSLKAGHETVQSDEIIQWCRSHLAAFKCPRTVVFVELPKTSTGKVQKYLLREWARAL